MLTKYEGYCIGYNTKRNFMIIIDECFTYKHIIILQIITTLKDSREQLVLSKFSWLYREYFKVFFIDK